MAFKLDLDGTKTTLPDTKLETLQKAVGGYIQFVPFPKPTDEAAGMYVNDEGLMMGLHLNTHASQIALQPIVGSVVVMTKAEILADMGGDDEDDEDE